MKIVTIKEKLDIIKSAFGEGASSSDGKNISVQCPVCIRSSKVKKKKKLSICLETGMFHCWVCESKGRNITSFARKNGIKNDALDKLRNVFGSASEKEEECEFKLALPDDFRLLSLSRSGAAKMLKKYLRQRGLSDDDIFMYKAGFSNEFGFKDKIIFPSFDEELNLNYFLARVSHDKTVYKYKNCEISKKEVIFNENMIDWNTNVFLVEGVFDAIKIGKNAIPILGSWIDENYLVFRKIIKENTPVTICLDLDAREKQIKIAKKLYEYGIDIKTVDLPVDIDLGGMSKQDVTNLLKCAKPFDNTQRMRYLINGISSGSVY
jgi:DNA primase